MGPGFHIRRHWTCIVAVMQQIMLLAPHNGVCRYVVYVDGQLAAHLPLIGNTTADGGQPILLDTADIFLCGRSDGDPRRYFSGSITHLAIWDLALTDTQV